MGEIKATKNDKLHSNHITLAPERVLEIQWGLDSVFTNQENEPHRDENKD